MNTLLDIIIISLSYHNMPSRLHGPVPRGQPCDRVRHVQLDEGLPSAAGIRRGILYYYTILYCYSLLLYYTTTLISATALLTIRRDEGLSTAARIRRGYYTTTILIITILVTNILFTIILCTTILFTFILFTTI